MRAWLIGPTDRFVSTDHDCSEDDQPYVTETAPRRLSRAAKLLGLAALEQRKAREEDRERGYPNHDGANGTLQDRLVKEMRLAGISNIEAGNAFLRVSALLHGGL